MPIPAAPPAEISAVRRPPSKNPRRAYIALAVLALVTVVLAVVWHRYWPFAEQAVIQNLQEAGDGQVHIRSFRPTYFPSPGCVLEGVVLMHGTKAPSPLITIDRLTIRGSYLTLIARRVSNITADGLHIFIPPFGTADPFHITQSTVTISELVARDAILDFLPNQPGQPPFRFNIHEAVLRDVGWSGPLTYRVRVHNPEPPGEVSASGKFGVWDQSNAANTPISGEYKFEQADLSVFDGISGILSSSGKFQGSLGHIDISGTTDTPDFMVTMSGHTVPLTSQFSANVDAIHGDTYLDRVDARFRKTHVLGKGSIAGRENAPGKIAKLNLSVTNGRVEDVLRLFVRQETSPMSGGLTFSSNVELPPGDEPFLKKVKLDGHFTIADSKFSNPDTQSGLDKLSAGARGLNKSGPVEPVAADVEATAQLKNAVAHFSDLDFRIPGAHARVRGTYQLISHAIDLDGQMWLDTKLSKTTTGVKAFASKMMDPFFHKGQHKGEIVPVHLGGTYEKPSYGLALEDQKAEDVPPPQPRSKTP
jgi:AsmA-like C-terminal region